MRSGINFHQSPVFRPDPADFSFIAFGKEALAQDQLRLHPASITFALSTTVESRALAYAQLTSIPLGGSRTDATA
ncbi:hypothetical protein MTO96_039439 [Rhipicephalus appendiculatus]